MFPSCVLIVPVTKINTSKHKKGKKLFILLFENINNVAKWFRFCIDQNPQQYYIFLWHS